MHRLHVHPKRWGVAKLFSTLFATEMNQLLVLKQGVLVVESSQAVETGGLPLVAFVSSRGGFAAHGLAFVSAVR